MSDPTEPLPQPQADADDLSQVVARDYVAELDDASDAGRWVVSKINTDAVDRFNTVILPQGVDRSAYLKNPVVLWEHGKDPARGRRPIGRNLWIKPTSDGRGLVAKTAFADDEFSRGVFALYRDQVLRGWSVNGDALDAGRPTAAEVRARPELAIVKVLYRRIALHEYSAVAIPGNPDAVTEAVARGLWVPELVRARFAATPPPAPPLPPLVGRTLGQVVASVERRARELALSEIELARADVVDLARGKV